MKLTGLFWILSVPLLAAEAQYSARMEGGVVHLEDARNQTIVSVIPTVGNIAYEMKVKGQNVIRFPYANVEEMKKQIALDTGLSQ